MPANSFITIHVQNYGAPGDGIQDDSPFTVEAYRDQTTHRFLPDSNSNKFFRIKISGRSGDIDTATLIPHMTRLR